MYHCCFVFVSPHFSSTSWASTFAFETMCVTVPHPWYQHHPCCSCIIRRKHKKMQELKFPVCINTILTRDYSYVWLCQHVIGRAGRYVALLHSFAAASTLLLLFPKLDTMFYAQVKHETSHLTYTFHIVVLLGHSCHTTEVLKNNCCPLPRKTTFRGYAPLLVGASILSVQASASHITMLTVR